MERVTMNEQDRRLENMANCPSCKAFREKRVALHCSSPIANERLTLRDVGVAVLWMLGLIIMLILLPSGIPQLVGCVHHSDV